MIVHNVFKKKYNQIMRKLSILTLCLVLCACAGTRTIDGETTKNWVKIVSSKTDNSGSIKDVCFVFNLSFYPGTAYDRLKNNPSSCLEQCCWYSENKTVDFYFNDGFTKDLDEEGVSRRYYPDHVSIKMHYASFVNRLSARPSSDVISKDGVVTLDFEDVAKAEDMLNKDFSNYQAKNYTKEDAMRGSELKHSNKVISDYKTMSMSGVNRDELLAQAQAEYAKDSAHAQEIAEMYSALSNGEEIKPSSDFDMQVSPFDAENRAIDKSMKDAAKAKKQALKEQEAAKKKELKAAQEQAKESAKEIETAVTVASATTANAVSPKVSAAVTPKTSGTKASNTKSSNVKAGTAQASKTKENKVKDEPMYDVQKPASQDNKVEYKEVAESTAKDTNVLQQKLAYERTQAVTLLKRFYGSEIDAYLRFLDKAKKKEGQVLFTDDKVWQTQKIGTPIYKVTCKVNGKIALLGADVGTPTTNYPIACGTYIVDLDEKTVEAKDALARKIVKKKY